MVLSSYADFISLAVAINLASVFIDPTAVSISGFHELINKRLNGSIERFSKLGLEKLMPAILLKENLFHKTSLTIRISLWCFLNLQG